jgi:hypothetical protein
MMTKAGGLSQNCKKGFKRKLLDIMHLELISNRVPFLYGTMAIGLYHRPPRAGLVSGAFIIPGVRAAPQRFTPG